MLLFRLKVTSRKLMIFLFASMVIRSPLRLKIRQISFFMFSVSLGVVLVVASPSSFNKKFLQNSNSWENLD